MIRSRRVNAHLDMQNLSTVMNLPAATDDTHATPLAQVKALVGERQPDPTDYLAAYLLAKS